MTPCCLFYIILGIKINFVFNYDCFQTNYGALQYLDVSMGKMVSEIKTKQGRLDVMAQNPQNAVIHLGHTDGEFNITKEINHCH